MKPLCVKIPEILEAELEEEARRSGKTKSAIIRLALEVHLGGKKTAGGSSFLDLARDLVGCVEGPPDLSTSKKHLRGYGQ